MRKDGGWIFISHSHRDIKTVRKIRNRFEELGFEPLLFYLKCLTDKNEIEGLVRREIQEREWFVYVDSDNSRSSDWVKSELGYLKELGNKKFFEIDARRNVIEQVNAIARGLKVYIISSHIDGEAADTLTDALVDREFLVLNNDQETLDTPEKYMSSLERVLEETARDGFVIFLASEASVRSMWPRAELMRALEEGATVIPLLLGDTSIKELPIMLRNVRAFNISHSPTEEELERVLDELYHYVGYKMSCDIDRILGEKK